MVPNNIVNDVQTRFVCSQNYRHDFTLYCVGTAYVVLQKTLFLSIYRMKNSKNSGT